MSASAMLVTMPSPLAGEGSSVLPRVMMGEGVRVTRTPHPFEFVGAPLCPLPQGERAREASTDMSANEATQRRGAKHQPAAVGNDRRLRSLVSGLLFTMDGATPTCRAVGCAPPRTVGRCRMGRGSK